MKMKEEAIEKLREQQSKVKERSAQWMVAEQLMDICRREPLSAELIAQDLENPEMSIVEAEKKIKAHADKHKCGNFSCVTPAEAEDILRKFYGLPDPETIRQTEPSKPERPVFRDSGTVDLADFLG